MLIEVKGAGFVNKGAELMLRAVLQKVGDAFPDASFAIAAKNSEDYLKRAKLGLYQKIWHQRYRVQWGKFGWIIPRSTRKRYGLVTDEEVDVVLDTSGFSYGDQWGERRSQVMASYVKTWKKRGVKVILLPQAMGPFTSRKIRKAFAFIVENADLVFLRDEASYKHVVELVGERENIHQAPDFTNLVSDIMPHDPGRFRDRFCLVPNYRMIDKTSANESELYPSFCSRCIKYLIKSGHKPFILIHEGEKDIWLAERIVKEARTEIEIVKETDALKIKGILGFCSGVISSRYHGLVSALSQGVPALATGWSHKYEMLFKEYGIPDGCLSVSIDPETLNKKIETITNDDSRKEIISQITKVSAIHKEQTEVMWQKVFSVIEK